MIGPDVSRLEDGMPVWTSYALLVGALIIGLGGAFLAAKVSTVFFWVGWIIALGGVGFYLWKVGKEEKPAAPPTQEQDSADTPPDSQ